MFKKQIKILEEEYLKNKKKITYEERREKKKLEEEFNKKIQILKEEYIRKNNSLREKYNYLNKILEGEKIEKVKQIKQEEMKQKILTYPLVPKEYSIQKHLLGVNNRKKEVLLIDTIIKLDSDFKEFLFNGIYNPEGEEGSMLKEILYINNRQDIKFIIPALTNITKYGYDHIIFKEFLIRYFDLMHKNNIYNNKIETQMIIILSPPFYNSSKNILDLYLQFNGDIWDKINSFIK